jgi:hypothetical protein
MDGGKNWMNHRLDPDGYEELIHTTQISDDCCHIIRTCKERNGAWTVCLISVVRDLPDGSQEATDYLEPWTNAELREHARKHPAD